MFENVFVVMSDCSLVYSRRSSSDSAFGLLNQIYQKKDYKTNLSNTRLDKGSIYYILIY